MGAPCNLKCRKTQREIRLQLLMFAMANFFLGMGTFMFLLCSSSTVHRGHLEDLFSDPITYFSPDNHSHHHKGI